MEIRKKTREAIEAIINRRTKIASMQAQLKEDVKAVAEHLDIKPGKLNKIIGLKVLLGVVLCMPLLAYASVTNNIFLNQIEKYSDSFVIGKSGPVFTEFFDPDCPYCHFLYEAMKPYVKAGIIRVREVPLAVIDPNSLRRSVFLLQSKHPGSVLSKGEAGYRYGHLAIPLAHNISAGLQARLADNARILGLGDSMGGIPFLVFQNKKAGKVGAMVGLPSPYALRQAIVEAGGNVHAVLVSGNGAGATPQFCAVPAT